MNEDEWGGHRLRVAMVEARMTQRELADGTGVALQTVGRHMRGKTPITVQQLFAYARVLGVDPATLLPRLDSNQEPTGSRIAA